MQSLPASGNLVPASAIESLTTFPAPPSREQLLSVSVQNLRLTVSLRKSDAQGTFDQRSPIRISAYLTLCPLAEAAPIKPFPIDSCIRESLDGKGLLSLDYLPGVFMFLAKDWPGETLRVVAVLSGAIQRVEGGTSIEFTLRKKICEDIQSEKWEIEDLSWQMTSLKFFPSIANNKLFHQPGKPTVNLDLEVWRERELATSDRKIEKGPEMCQRVVDQLCECLEGDDAYGEVLEEDDTSSTAEAMLKKVIVVVLKQFSVRKVKVKCEQLGALTMPDEARIEMVRER